MLSRKQLRTEMRQRRQALSAQDQHQAALDLRDQVLQQPDLLNKQHFALYLSNDGEIDTQPLFQALLNLGKQLYLPILHPFSPGYLIFQHFTSATKLSHNKFGIPEPELNCQALKPVAELEVIFTPLVAFDQHGQRLGMGGGFYDRTLAPFSANSGPLLVGLAHSCQQVAALPTEPWDKPVHAIATAKHFWRFVR